VYTGGCARQWVRPACWWEVVELREGCAACVSEKGGVRSWCVRVGAGAGGGHACRVRNRFDCLLGRGGPLIKCVCIKGGGEGQVCWV